MGQITPDSSDALAREGSLRALYELAVLASGVRDPGEVAKLAVDHARLLLAADGAVVFAFDVTTGLLEPVQETESPVSEPPIAPGEGAIGIAFRTSKPVRIDDYQNWEHSIQESARRGMVSGLAVPLIAEDRPIGALGVWTLDQRAFTDSEVQLLSLIAAQLAPALQAARLTEEAQRKAQMFQALHEVAVAAAGVLAAEVLAKLVTERALQLLKADGAGLWWLDPEPGRLAQVAVVDTRQGAVADVEPGQGAIGLAYQKRRAVMIDDYQTWPGAIPQMLKKQVAALAAVPLVVGDRPAGSIAVWSYQRRRFDPEDIQLLALFAAQVAPAIESAHLTAQAAERARTFEALHELSVAAGGVLDPKGLASLAVDRATDLLEADSSALVWWDPEAELLRVLADNAEFELTAPEAGAMQGASGLAFQQRKAVIIGDYASWPGAHQTAVTHGVRSIAAVPLFAGDRPVGALVVRSRRAGAFDQAGGRLMSLLGAQVAPALEAARLLGQREAQAAAFRILHELAVAGGGVLIPQVLAGQAVNFALELTGSDAATLGVWDEASGVIVALAGTEVGWAPEDAPTPGVGALGVALESRREVVVDDYQTWAHAHPAGLREGFRSTLAVPLLVGDRALGALSVRRSTLDPYHREHVTLLSLLAAQVAPALAAARLVEERQHQAAAFVALHQLAVAAGGVLQAEDLAKLAVEQACELFNLERAALYWWDEASSRLVQLAFAGERGSTRLRSGVGTAGVAFAVVQAVEVGDYQNWESSSKWARQSGYQSALAVPLLVQDRPVGAITMSSRARRRFSSEETQLLTLLAAQVAPALEAARLYANLARSESRFRSLYDTIACGVLVQDPTGIVMDANRAAEEIFGLSLAQMRGRPSSELWEASDEDGAHDARPAMMALRSRQPVRNFTMRVLRRDGQARWLQADSIPVLNAAGEPAQVVSSLIDVTERRRAEAALKESEERFHAVFDRSAIGIARVGLDGDLIETNPALGSMLGYEAWELVGTPISALIHPEDFNPSVLTEMTAGRENGVQLEVRALRRNSTLMWGNATASLVRGEGGEPLFLIWMIEDISARKGQEAELEHQALHDALTGLPNRSLLHDRLLQAIRLGQRDEQPMALMMMDLDRFKDVNDTFGHHSGDLLLRAVAVRLTAELRASDTVARLGGDEFAIVMMGVDSEAFAAAAARKLLRALEPPFEIDGERFDVGASIGIALFPQHGDDADSLMRRADVAMYVAKRSGSGYAVYSPEEDTNSPERLALSGKQFSSCKFCYFSCKFR